MVFPVVPGVRYRVAIRGGSQWGPGYLFHTQQVYTSSHMAFLRAQRFSQEESALQCGDDPFRGETCIVLAESALGQDSVSQPFGVVHRVAAFLAVFFSCVFSVDCHALGCLWYT